MADIHEALNAATTVYRKGEVVEERQEGVVAVTEVYGFPSVDEAPAGIQLFDVEFVVIGVDPAEAEERREDVLEWLRAYPEPIRLAGGPSYMEVGAHLGDQTLAFQLFALGQVLGLWELITPLTLLGPLAPLEQRRALAGNGYIMMSGWNEEEDGDGPDTA